MGDPWARFIRIDRDGGIVSARFNYRKRSDLLLEFLWRYSTATDISRGKDPTVQRASPADSKLAQDKLSKWMPKDAKTRVIYQMTISNVSPEVSNGDNVLLEDSDNDARLHKDSAGDGNDVRHEGSDNHRRQDSQPKTMRALLWAHRLRTPFRNP